MGLFDRTLRARREELKLGLADESRLSHRVMAVLLYLQMHGYAGDGSSSLLPGPLPIGGNGR